MTKHSVASLGRVRAYGGLAALVAMSSAACAAPTSQATSPEQTMNQIRAELGAERARSADLETRLLRVEQSLRPSKDSSPTLLTRLEQLIALNQQLIAEQRQQHERSEAGKAQCVDNGPSEEQLQLLLERLSGTGDRFQGPLTPAQTNALRVLLRGPRNLDTDNPWSQWY